MPFPEKLRLLMRRHGLTQTSLGGRLGISQRAVGKWLAGDSAPGADVAKRLSEFLRVPIDDLLDDTRDLPGAHLQTAAEAALAAFPNNTKAQQGDVERRLYLHHWRQSSLETAEQLRAKAADLIKIAETLELPFASDLANRDTEHAAADRDLQKAREQGKFKDPAPPGQKNRSA